jgi:hypothetical protein
MKHVVATIKLAEPTEIPGLGLVPTIRLFLPTAAEIAAMRQAAVAAPEGDQTAFWCVASILSDLPESALKSLSDADTVALANAVDAVVEWIGQTPELARQAAAAGH